ncbi:MAG TPA: DUF3619 family protein [Accumulibacter sp.]|uniref:DUF3619 family protein n=2 Tax=Candidatus Accumulibacter TaxID=327159 RepID=A0A080M9B0_9PROT|nr:MULTISPECIES: DUF3619 family protein [Candidatus Accumulibacter]KFB77892.1 MAG: hypothetical protein AW06_000778 [Candidatus Accumulibacter cognatus]MBL8402479.1 DUF3619 family protein [Accumulibacter sp.]MBN8517718.1 DUF3619 family protein [Accumulibacter sp.]MBO3709507.1 DUF3619 family protein [Accumulibacter sp.]MCC2867880.1 DUF3619 family protein [Candidatus Accumulibacter phosphatis]
MNELHFAYKIRQHLNRGLNELPAGTLKRLESARQQALSQQKVLVHQSVLAGVGNFVQHQVDNLHIKQVLLALIVVLGITSYTYWYADQSITELEIIDSALLSDDLPIAAFTDKGFDAWLKSSASQ